MKWKVVQSNTGKKILHLQETNTVNNITYCGHCTDFKYINIKEKDINKSKIKVCQDCLTIYSQVKILNVMEDENKL